MTAFSSLGLLTLSLAGFQGMMVARNLRLFLPPPKVAGSAPPMSVLIPARNEQDRLPNLLSSLLTQRGLDFEVIVLDDDSQDQTRAVALEMASRDPRFRLIEAPVLPAGWAGKQYACHLLSLSAKYDQWLFLDADVVLTEPDALARISHNLAAGEAAMQSGIPHQRTAGWAEQLIVPLIHLVLLGFLPFWEMRRNRLPALGAACGQMVAVKASAYRQVGGHSAVRRRLHDATALAALFRREGYLTDLFDATPLAECRMYEKAWDVFEGFSKNATEGMAQPHILPVWTFLLLGANVLPWLLLALGGSSTAAVLAAVVDLGIYLALMQRYRQNPTGAMTRPLGVAAFMAIQWVALAGKWLGWRSTWKGRSYHRIHG